MPKWRVTFKPLYPPTYDIVPEDAERLPDEAALRKRLFTNQGGGIVAVPPGHKVMFRGREPEVIEADYVTFDGDWVAFYFGERGQDGPKCVLRAEDVAEVRRLDDDDSHS